MPIKFQFNIDAAHIFAKELRRASWGMILVTSAGGLTLDNALIMLAGCIGWVVMQVLAFTLQSLKFTRGKK